jgi:hypothetical protein
MISGYLTQITAIERTGLVGAANSQAREAHLGPKPG